MSANSRISTLSVSSEKELIPSKPDEGLLTIGAAAIQSELPTKTVRYYADVGLVVPSHRAANGYRLYGARELEQLIFVRRARSFGFAVEDCRELLGLYSDDERTSRDVKEIALRRIHDIEVKMKELQELHQELSQVAASCSGDDLPDCPILHSLARR